MTLYVSPIKNYRQPISKGIPAERHPATGEVLSWRVRPLAAAFGQLGDEQPVYNPLTGETVMVADIVTGVYDSEVAQQQNGWTDEEREIVEASLDKVAATIPAYVRKLEAVHVAAPAPWQTYDETDETKITALAVELGLVPEALRYERENQNRERVTGGLENAMTPEEEGRAKPLEKIEVPTQGKPDLRIGKTPKSTDSGIPVDTPGFTPKNPGQITR